MSEGNAQRRWSGLGSQLTAEGASGRLIERTPGSFDFVPDNEPLVLPIANPDRIASAAVGPLLKVYGNLDADSGDIQLRDYQIDFAPPPTGPQLELIRISRSTDERVGHLIVWICSKGE